MYSRDDMKRSNAMRSAGIDARNGASERCSYHRVDLPTTDSPRHPVGQSEITKHVNLVDICNISVKYIGLTD